MNDTNQVSGIIAENLRRERLARGLSISQLAEVCGISRVLLCQVERGDSNLTINTIWKITSALNIPYTALFDAPAAEAVEVRGEDALKNSQLSVDGKCRVYCYYPSARAGNVELFGMDLKPGGRHVSPGHLSGAREYAYVSRGELTISAGGREHVLRAGDALWFASDGPHEYRNDCEDMVVAVVTNAYN